MERVPLHARSAAIAQTILGCACGRVELAPPESVSADDDREFYVAAWCMDPRFVPEEKIIFIPEPDVLLPGGALFLRAEDIVHDSLPGLQYLVRIRIVEFQDWNSQPTSDDEDYRRDDSEHDGSDDSNHNRRHPGLDQGGDGIVGRGRSDVPGLRMLIHALEDAVELRLCRAAL